MKEAAIELFMKTHGGRSFLKGHIFAENVYDFLAPCIYEGEGEILGLAFFKSLIKEHGKQFFEPIGKALQANGIKNFSPLNPLHLLKLRQRDGRLRQVEVRSEVDVPRSSKVPNMDGRLAAHVDFAQAQFGKLPEEISGTMVKHQLKLADRQCRMAELSQRIQDVVTILVTALWAHGKKTEAAIASADMLCQDLRRKLTGERPSDCYFKDATQLADLILSGGFEILCRRAARRDHDEVLRQAISQ